MQWAVLNTKCVSFVKRILKKAIIVPPPESYFVSLTFPNFSVATPILPEIAKDVNALELRVDFFENFSDDFVTEQISLVRRYTDLPIIFTVRTKEQGGNFTGNEAEIFRLLNLGLYLCCEYIDVELGLDVQKTSEFLQKKRKFPDYRIIP